MSTFLEIQLPDGVLEQARRGDAAARGQLCATLARPVYTLIRRLIAQPAIAEELLQEVCLDVLVALPSYGGGSFAGWVRSIAVNKALMHLRSPWQRRQALSDVDGVLAQQTADPDNDATDRSGELERALNALPDQARAVVWLHDVEGYTHGEIARLFGRTTSFSKSVLARAHVQLRAQLEPMVDELSCTLVPKI
jgi:RNA polymerase sigma-70 factor (ECF subfamily)